MNVTRLVIVVIAAFPVCLLHADAIFDNSTAASGGADCVESDNANATCNGFPQGGQLYDSFSAGAVSAPITEIDLVLNGDPASSGSVSVGLYADNASMPGSLLASLGTVNDAALSFTMASYDIPLTAMPVLEPNTRYWIGLSGDTSAGWSWSSDTSGVGVAAEYFSNPNGTFPDVFGPYQMTVVTGAPEPGTFYLTTIGIVIAGFIRSRRGSAHRYHSVLHGIATAATSEFTHVTPSLDCRSR